MFGLMKPVNCQRQSSQKLNHLSQRLHYCGTCKTLGRLYGQRTRLLLNYDTVFLAELLTSLSGVAACTGNWAAAYQSKNCLRLPSEDQTPLALQFAAAANVLLSEFKLCDKINDSRERRWQVVKTFLKEPFQLAAQQLISWGFPLSQLWQWETLQNQREAEVSSAIYNQPAESVLEYLAEPTAQATAMFFDNGARLIGREDARPEMSQLGRLFGKLIYLLDAFEDYRDDIKRKNFNAYRAAYKLSEPELPYQLTNHIKDQLIAIGKELANRFQALPIAADQVKVFAGRLQAALGDRVSKMTESVEERKARKAQWSNSFLDNCCSGCGDGCGDCCCDCACDSCCDGCDCHCDCGS